MAIQGEKIILGIDPGTTAMGYGLIKTKGKKAELLAMGVIQLHKIDDHYARLERIFSRCIGLIDEYLPDEMALEAPFFGKNVQSMLKLGRAQGVAMSSALSRKLPVSEYAPRKIKQSVTGKGSASKEQVAAMLQQILKIPQDQMPKQLDATDGLAAALCHFYQMSSPTGGKGYTGWEAFVKQNEGKIKSKK